MYRIIDDKSTGKTGRLLLLAKEHGGIVVCSNPKAMKEKAYAYGITGIEYVSYGDFHYEITHTTNPYDSRPIFIDELDKYLLLIDPNLAGYTISKE
jgi:hypothetical protein